MRLKLLSLASILLIAFVVSSAFPAGFAFVDLKPKANSKILNTSWWTGAAGSSDLEELLDKAKDGAEFEMPWGGQSSF